MDKLMLDNIKEKLNEGALQKELQAVLKKHNLDLKIRGLKFDTDPMALNCAPGFEPAWVKTSSGGFVLKCVRKRRPD